MAMLSEGRLPSASTDESFQETNQEEIELHGDDPMAMIVLLRYLYDLPYDDLTKDPKTSLHSLAQAYVVADKYQAVRLRDEIHHQIEKHDQCRDLTDHDDFFNALDVIVTGTTPQVVGAHATMIDVCVTHINSLSSQAAFSSFLQEHGEVGAEIINHNNLSLTLQGDWYCDCDARVEALPRCYWCFQSFPNHYLRDYHNEEKWTCPHCGQIAPPYCMMCEADVKWT